MFFEAFIAIIDTLDLIFITFFMIFEAVLALVTVSLARVGTGSVRGT
jgi:hypothetical protein